MILAADLGRLILESQLLHKQSIRVFVGGELHRGAPWNVKVKPQERPLALALSGHVLDGGHVEGHEHTLRIVGHKNRVVLLVHVQKAWLEILRELLFVAIGLDVLHALHLLLLSAALNLSALPPLSELLDLPVLQLTLRLEPRLILFLLLEVLLPQPRALNLTLVHLPAHVH